MRKLVVLLLTGVICLLGITSVLAVTYNEAPMLRTMVAAGELPPVEERLPEEPFITEPFGEVGRYGGTLHTYATGQTVWQDLLGNIYDEPALGDPMMIAPDGKWYAPFLLKDYEFTDSYKTLTIHLRKGAKWSDGAPLTADDFTFYWIDCKPNFSEEVPFPETPLPGNLQKVERVDDYTVRFYFPEPFPAAILDYLHANWGMWGPFIPKHYLEKWHIKYNPKANELAKEEKFANWWEALEYHGTTHPMQNDLDLPMMGAWILKERKANLNIFERNPYYFAVDTAGNQLPYIDRVVSQVVSPEVYELKILSGAADIAKQGVTLANYPLYKKNEEKGNYHILLKPGIDSSNLAIYFNLFDEDLVLRNLYRDVRFRRALSLGVNREEINEGVFFGKAEIRQTILIMTTLPWYKKEWDQYYTQHDPQRANALLDEIGLEWDKNHEYRLRPDGKPLTLVCEYMEPFNWETSILELIKKQYRTIGINFTLKREANELFRQRAWTAGIASVMASQVGYGELPWVGVYPIWAYPGSAYTFARPWFLWLDSGGVSGEEPPEDIKEQYARVEKLRTMPMLSDEAGKLFVEITEFALEKLWYIGTVGKASIPIIVKNTLGNVMEYTCEYESRFGGKYLIEPIHSAHALNKAEQLYFKE